MNPAKRKKLYRLELQKQKEVVLPIVENIKELTEAKVVEEVLTIQEVQEEVKVSPKKKKAV